MAYVPAAGIGLFALWRIYRDKQLHFPGHKYLGPGSDVYSGDIAVDKDDLIAFDHDREYQTLVQSLKAVNIPEKQFLQELGHIDHKAVLSFIHDFKTTGNWHSLIGATGIGAKILVDKTHLLPTYPVYSSKYGTTKKLRHASTLDSTRMVRDE